jgi:hypothetical protein
VSEDGLEKLAHEHPRCNAFHRAGSRCVFRFIVTADFGIVTGHFGDRDRRDGAP